MKIFFLGERIQIKYGEYYKVAVVKNPTTSAIIVIFAILGIAVQ